MFHIPLIAKVLIGSMILALILVAADTSPYTPWILGALVPIGLLIVGLLWNLQRDRRKERLVEDEKKLKERDDLQRRLTQLETQISPFWATLQTKLADALHHPHPESLESDALLEKLEKLTITGPERDRLGVLLSETIADPKIATEEKAKAQMLILAMPLVTGERAGIKAASLINPPVLLPMPPNKAEATVQKMEIVNKKDNPVPTVPGEESK